MLILLILPILSIKSTNYLTIFFSFFFFFFFFVRVVFFTEVSWHDKDCLWAKVALMGLRVYEYSVRLAVIGNRCLVREIFCNRDTRLRHIVLSNLGFSFCIKHVVVWRLCLQRTRSVVLHSVSTILRCCMIDRTMRRILILCVDYPSSTGSLSKTVRLLH